MHVGIQVVVATCYDYNHHANENPCSLTDSFLNLASSMMLN